MHFGNWHIRDMLGHSYRASSLFLQAKDSDEVLKIIGRIAKILSESEFQLLNEEDENLYNYYFSSKNNSRLKPKDFLALEEIIKSRLPKEEKSSKLDDAFDEVLSTLAPAPKSDEVMVAVPSATLGLPVHEPTVFDRNEIRKLIEKAGERAVLGGNNSPTDRQMDFLADLVTKARDEEYLSTLEWPKYELTRSECSKWIDTYLGKRRSA